MKKNLFLLLLTILIISQTLLSFVQSAEIYPMVDLHTQGKELPRNFRSVQTPFASEMGKKTFNKQGLEHLNLSGSGQFSKKNFFVMLDYLQIAPEKLIVIDLREESHGLINDLPMSWTNGSQYYMNMGKTDFEIMADEASRLQLAAQAGQIVLHSKREKILRVTINTAKTEEELVVESGATYLRWPVTDHHTPSNEIVDRFIALIKDLKPDQWIHFHCRGGNGRTSTFMVLYDIVKNGSDVSLKDILKRQTLMGGKNLTDDKETDPEKIKFDRDRLEFLQKFYLYFQQVPNLNITWSKWLKTQVHSL